MSKLIETLKAAGWVETTMGECLAGDEVLVTQTGETPRALRVTKPAEWRGDKGASVSTNDGCARRDTTPVLREPRPKRPEYAPGTVALIRERGGKSLVRAWKVPGQWILTGGIPLDDDSFEVVRVLLPADQDTPTVEVTDEMVERAAMAQYRLDWGLYLDENEWSSYRETYRASARRVLEAALEVEK